MTTGNWTNTLARAGLAAALALSLSVPAHAGRADEPDGFEKVGDLVIARPLGAVITVVGAAAFVVSLPFTAAGGNVKQAADSLVVQPARETFVRCLGCKAPGRYVDPNRSK